MKTFEVPIDKKQKIEARQNVTETCKKIEWRFRLDFRFRYSNFLFSDYKANITAYKFDCKTIHSENGNGKDRLFKISTNCQYKN